MDGNVVWKSPWIGEWFAFGIDSIAVTVMIETFLEMRLSSSRDFKVGLAVY
jgi:hypothetical protein